MMELKLLLHSLWPTENKYPKLRISNCFPFAPWHNFKFMFIYSNMFIFKQLEYNQFMQLMQNSVCRVKQLSALSNWRIRTQTFQLGSQQLNNQT